MAATDLGKVGIVTKGTWSSSATYEILDAVSYNGGLYIAKQAVPANTTPTNTTYWQAAIVPTIDTASVNLSTVDADISGTLYLRRQGDLVTINLYDVKITANKTFAAAIPDGFRPTSAAARVRGAIIKGGTSDAAMFYLVEEGDIKLNGADTGEYYYGTITFIR